MPTLADADLPSDSDPEDGDFKDADVDAEEDVKTNSREEELPSSRQNDAVTNQVWADMVKDDVAATARRPPSIQLDGLMRQLQQRHLRPPKDRSRRAVFAQLAKYTPTSVAGAEPLPVVAEIKKRVRAEAVLARSAATEAPRVPRLKPDTQVLREKVRFAGELVSVSKCKALASKTEQNQTMATKRRASRKLGGKLAGLDEFLESQRPMKDITTVEKSGMDWHAHKESAGLNDLDRDKHAGALDRKNFLAKAEAAESIAMKRQRK